MDKDKFKVFILLFTFKSALLEPASSSSDAVDECSDYRELGSGRRAITYYDPHNEKCDDHLKLGWYRFTRHAGRMMPTKCVAKFHCGAYAPGWLDGVHPMPQDGRVMRRVCFHLKGECCKEVVNIQVRNCGDFMVYHLPPTPKCPLMYCGDEVNEDASIHECKTHGVLTSTERAQGFYNPYVSLTDAALTPGWYRFNGDAGSQMADKCVKLFHCGTHATGWLRGAHPSIAEGAVMREVCFHWLGDCCHFKQQILVRQCKGFFVYELPGTEKSFLRYCGNGTVHHRFG